MHTPNTPLAPRISRLPAAITLALIAALRANAAPLDPPAELLNAYEQLRNGHYTRALESAQRIAAERPADPLPLLLEAQAHFDLLYCQTGHINSREVWHLAKTSRSPHDALLLRALNQAAALAGRMKQDPATAAAGHFLNGGVHAYRARLATLREQTLASGREGRRMREELLSAVALDQSFAPEATFGLGMYNYFADALSPLLKFLRLFLAIPGGDMERGLAQLHEAAAARSLAAALTNGRTGEDSPGNSAPAILMQPEARWELARIVGSREGRHDEALRLLAPLMERYPDNGLFALLAALEAEGMGDQELARRLAERTLEAVKRMDPGCRARLEPAARGALERITATLASFAEPAAAVPGQ